MFFRVRSRSAAPMAARGMPSSAGGQMATVAKRDGNRDGGGHRHRHRGDSNGSSNNDKSDQ